MDHPDTTRDNFGQFAGSSSGPGPALMGAHTLLGNDVSNKDGKGLGDIKEFMIDMASGRVAYAVLSFGGLLGMGDKLFAVPWAALSLDTVNKRFSSVSRVIAAQGTAKSLSPMPSSPPNDSTAYATLPLAMSIMNSLMSPRSSPCLL